MSKICIIQRNLSVAGGAERVATILSNEFCMQHDITVLSIFSDGGKTFYKLDDRITYVNLFKTHMRTRRVLLSGLMKLIFLFQKERFDIVLGVGVSSFILSIISARITKTKIIACEHSNLLNPGKNSTIQKLSHWLGVRGSNHIVVLTQADYMAYINKYCINKDKISYIYNFLEEKVFANSRPYVADTKKIITVGRIDAVKGYDFLVNVASKVLTQHPSWEWHIWGEVSNLEYLNAVETKIKQFGLETRLLLKGKTSRIYSIYGDYSLYVMTSKFEGFPMVLLEAQANSLPIVSFDCPQGPREIVEDSVNGFLIPCYDVNAMAEKINNLLENRELRVQMSKNTQKNLFKVKKKTIIAQWEQLFNIL